MTSPSAVPDFNRVRFVFSGHMRGGTQSWSTGIFAKVSTPPTLAQLQTDVNGLGAAFDAEMLVTGSNIAVSWDAGTRINDHIMYYYPANSPVATLVAVHAAANNPGSSTGYLPAQVAIVASLRTAMAGRKGRGRMYWPCVAAPLSSAGLLSATVTDNVCAFTRYVADQLSNLTWSGAAGQAVVAGAWPSGVPITSVVVDNKPDIQRRRSDKILATASSVLSVP